MDWSYFFFYSPSHFLPPIPLFSAHEVSYFMGLSNDIT